MSADNNSQSTATDVRELWKAAVESRTGKPCIVGSEEWQAEVYATVEKISQQIFGGRQQAGDILSVTDLAADVYERLVLFLRHKQPTLLTEAYIAKMAHNCLMDAYRKWQRELKLGEHLLSPTSSADLLQAITGGERTPSSHVIGDEQRKLVLTTVFNVLSENDALLVTLVYLRGCSYQEVAEIFQKSVPWVRGRHSRIMAMLRTDCAEKFPTQAENARRFAKS